jgi:hypothetical protein
MLIGAQDSGDSIGPWLTEGDWGVTVTNVVIDSAGDLVFAATSGGYATFAGGQDFLSSAGSVLVKVNHTNGNVMWRTQLAKVPAAVSIAPGNRIAVLFVQESESGPFEIGIHRNGDGKPVTSFVGGRTSSLFSGRRRLLASGTSDLYVIGFVDGGADFNPGSAVDTQGETPGVFISRYTF